MGSTPPKADGRLRWAADRDWKKRIKKPFRLDKGEGAGKANPQDMCAPERSPFRGKL